MNNYWIIIPLLFLIGCQPLPVRKESFASRRGAIRTLSSLQLEIIDTRITNWSSSVLLAWDSNTETNLAGYRLYHGDASRAYPYMVEVGLTNQHWLTVSRRVRNYFAVTAFNTAGLESDFSNEEVWPKQVPYYTNLVITVPYRIAASLDGPWLTYTARLHYLTFTNAQLFWQVMPIQIERAP